MGAIKTKDLIHWKGINPKDLWASNAKEKLSKLFSDVTVKSNNDGPYLLLIPSIGFRYEYDTTKVSRGVISYGDDDANQVIALLAIAMQTPVTLVNDEGEQISIKRLKPTDKHLKFNSMSYTDFEEKLKVVEVIRTTPMKNIRGAAAFI